MGTLNSVDVISQHYKLQMDLYVSSYASLAAETIERSMDEGTLHHITINYYNLFLKNRIRYICTKLMSVVVMLKCMKRFGFTASFNRCAVSGNDTQADFNRL